MSAASTYLHDNASDKAGTRMDVLARLYDPTSRRVLQDTGIAPGWRCLEVGGGGGSVARWMAERVGLTGSVLCTDLDTRIIERERPLPARTWKWCATTSRRIRCRRIVSISRMHGWS
jgi:2-polyprenyl-3-methyl-5-hydroxy-6-metoxy-1,4-benzoquinol methylase